MDGTCIDPGEFLQVVSGSVFGSFCYVLMTYIAVSGAVFGSLCRKLARRVALLTFNAMGKQLVYRFDIFVASRVWRGGPAVVLLPCNSTCKATCRGLAAAVGYSGCIVGKLSFVKICFDLFVSH